MKRNARNAGNSAEAHAIALGDQLLHVGAGEADRQAAFEQCIHSRAHFRPIAADADHAQVRHVGVARLLVEDVLPVALVLQSPEPGQRAAEFVGQIVNGRFQAHQLGIEGAAALHVAGNDRRGGQRADQCVALGLAGRQRVRRVHGAQ